MLAKTPPMGWNSWNTFAQNINEEMIMQTADAMVETGLAALGYEYVVIDDCWSLRERGADGRIVAGANGAGGELGHMVIRPNEPEACACGRHGCVQQYVSATGIVRVVKQWMDAHPEADTPMRDAEKLTAKIIFDAAAAGDAAALQALEDVYDAFGFFLAASCTVTDPEVIVIGGGVSKAGQPLLDGAEKGFKKYVFYPNVGTQFALAKLGNDAGIYGCCKLILDRESR